MEITSFQFFVMVGISLLIYWRVPHRYQWCVLLFDSLVFYFANATWYTFLYVCVSVGTTHAATVYFTRAGQGAAAQKKKKLVLASTIVLNVGILAVLKYTNLAIHTFNFLGSRLLNIQGISDVSWLAPLAISYYTLQLVAYAVDCSGGGSEPFDSALKLGLYTVYFPLMTSGPICRKSDLGEQLFAEHRFDYDRVKFGLYRIAWGLMKKLAIANRIAALVDQMWAAPAMSEGICVWIVAVLFALQLYTDFSGVIDIALGVSECFGIVLPENFNAPFFSRSVQELWGQRWHITLGAWLKDYIMYPICRTNTFTRWSRTLRKKYGKGGRQIPYYIAMFVVWTAMGIWHGSSWKYVVGIGWFFWALIVLGQVLEPVSKRVKNTLHIREENPLWAAFQMLRTFMLFSVGNIAFRADSLSDTINRLAGGMRISFDFHFLSSIKEVVYFEQAIGPLGLPLIVISLAAILVVDWLKYRGINVREKLAAKKWRWILYYAIVIMIYLSLSIENQEILYAQF